MTVKDKNKIYSYLYRKFREFIALFLSVILIINPFLINAAYAATPTTESVSHIIPDGSTETTIDRAQNGTPIVNIARPSSGGVSHNTFRDYNVLSDNAILNNFKGNVAKSQLGGALYGNPNFNKEGGRTANIILNEITSNRITRLEGYTEIFGDRAALIVANPNGIQTSGAGFINTSRLSLITGKPNLNPNDGTIDDFDINPNSQILITARNVATEDANGQNIIIPLGLDAGTTNYSEIISRTVKVSGEVYGGENFNIKTGNHKYNYNTKKATSNNENQDSKPEISIDGSAFGAMYAGRISFTSTEDGVGVKVAGGDLESTIDDINIDSNGNIEFEKLVAKNNITVTSNTGKVTQNKSSYAQNNVIITASQDVDIKGEYVYGANEVNITSQNNNINNNAHIEGKTATLTANKNINNLNSTILGSQLVRLTSTLGDINNGSASDGTNNSSIIQSNKDLYLVANNGSINNDYGMIKAVNDANLTANIISNQNTISDVAANLRGIDVQKDLTIVANSLINQAGYIGVSGKFDITLNESKLNNKDGLIYSSFYTDSLTPDDHKTSEITFNNLTTNINDSNEIGTILVNDYLLLNGDNISDLSNNGIIQTGNKLTIATNSFINNNEIKSLKDIVINVAGDFTNNKETDIIGKITALNSIDIQNANNFINRSDIYVMDEENIGAGTNNKLFTSNIQNDFTNSGTIVVDGDFTVSSATNFINNIGQVDVGDNISIIVSDSIQNLSNSSLLAKNHISLYGSNSITNTSSEIYSTLGNINLAKNIADDPATPQIELVKNESILNSGGRIEAAVGDINIATTDLINQSSLVKEDGTVNYSDIVIYDSEVPYRYINAWTDSGTYKQGGSWHWGIRFDKDLYKDGYGFTVDSMGVGHGISRKETKRKVNNTVRNYESNIKSGSHMFITADNLTNHLSIIHSKGDMKLQGNSLDVNSVLINKSYAIENTITYKCSSSCGGYELPNKNGEFIEDLGRAGIGHRSSFTFSGNTEKEVDKVAGHLTSAIISDGSFSAPGYSGGVDQESVRGNLDGFQANFTEQNPSSQIEDLKNNGFLNVTNGLDLPDRDKGFFKVNKPDDTDNNVSRKYLVETNSRFLDTSSFLGSDYFLLRIGFDPNTDINVQRLGDAVYEQRLIMNAINKVTNFEYLEDDINNDNEQVQRLYDNAFLEYDKNPDFEIGKALTKEQINNLEKDMIWLVEKEIDGQKLLVTEVYFAPDTITKLAEENNTTGAIIKAETVDIISDGDIKSDFGSIIATKGGINLSSQGNIDLLNSILNSTTTTSIVANNDVSIVNDKAYQGFSFTPDVIGSLSNQQSNKGLKVAGLLAGATTISPETQNIIDDAINARNSTTFNAGSDIQIVSGNDINIANNNFNTEGSIFIDAGNDINNSNYTIKASENVVINATNDINNIHTTNSADETRIEADKMVSMIAGNNITNRGATIKAGELLYLTAGNDINNEALITTRVNHVEVSNGVADSSNADHIRSTLESQGNLTSDGNLVLIAGNNINNVASNITTTGVNTNFAGEAYIEATAGDVNIVTDTLRDRTVARWHSKKNRGVSINDTTTNISSNLDVASNLTLVSGNDTNIKGSDLLIGGNLTTDSTGNLNIESVQDTSYGFYANYKRGSFGRRSRSTSTTNSTTNIVSNINVIGDINSTSEKNISVIASNLTSDSGNINLIAKDQINILSARDTFEIKTTSKKHGVTTTAINNKTNKTVTRITSDLNAGNGNISLTSGGNTTIIASNLSSGNDTNIKVGSYIDTVTNTETINNNATLNILNDMDSEYSYEYSSKMGASMEAIAVGMAAGFATGGLVGMAAGAYVGSQSQEGNVSMVETYDETIKASKITANNNINIEVASDALIRSSGLSSGNDVNIRVGSITDKNSNIINTNSNANLNITSAEEKHIRNEFHEEIKPDLVAVAGAAALSGAMISSGSLLMVAGGISVAKASEDNALANRDMKESRLNQTNQISSDIITENDLNAISANNINIVASNAVSDNGDLNLTSGGETNILSAIETSTLTTRTEHQDFSDFDAGIDRGRASVGVNADIDKETNSTTKSTVKSSNIAANNININSSSDVTVQASNIVANNNVDVTSTNGDVNLVSATNTTKNTQVKEDIDATLSVGIGNAYVDTAYAVDDAVKAGEAVKAAKDELSHMKNLKNQGRATDEAVKDSEINLALAVTNFSIATKLAAASVKKAAGAASTSLGTGFYGDVRMDMSNTKSTSNEVIVENIASLIIAGNNVDLTSTNKDINQKGSHITSTNGDVTYTAGNDVNIEASKDTYNYKFGSETVNSSITLASTNPVAMVVDNLAGSLGYQKSDQSINSITYNNSTTTANNININSGNDTAVKGANLLASNDLTVNVGNDLIVESKQNEYHAKGSSKGLNVGMGSNKNTNTGNYSFGFNSSKSRTDRVWVDDQTTLVANNSVTINTTNNTDMKGALIANIKTDGTDGGNLSLTTNSLTYEDIKDIESHYSKSLGGNLGIGTKDSYKVTEQAKGTTHYNINFENKGYEKEQITRATIGSGTINIAANSDISGLNRDIFKSQELTKDTITGNLKGEVSLETIIEAGKIAYGTGKAVYGVGNLAANTPKLFYYKDRAFKDEAIDLNSHPKAKEATGYLARSGPVAIGLGAMIELLQAPSYAVTYALKLQNQYDPLGTHGLYKNRPKPDLSGLDYAKDMYHDVRDMYNGSQGNFNYIKDINKYNNGTDKK